MTNKNKDFKKILKDVVEWAEALVSVDEEHSAKIEEKAKEMSKESEVEELKELVNSGITTFDVNGKEIEKPANFNEDRDRLIKEQQLSSTDKDKIMKVVQEKCDKFDGFDVKKFDSLEKMREWVDEKDLSVKVAKTQANFVEYISNNKKYITNIINYYKKIVETRDEFIALLKEGNSTLEKQTDFFMKTIHGYETTIEDFILATLPKETAPTMEDIYGEYKSGDKQKKLECLKGTFRRND